MPLKNNIFVDWYKNIKSTKQFDNMFEKIDLIQHENMSYSVIYNDLNLETSYESYIKNLNFILNNINGLIQTNKNEEINFLILIYIKILYLRSEFEGYQILNYSISKILPNRKN